MKPGLRPRVKRRSMLRGPGVSMALPWMESMRVWGDEAKGKERHSSNGRNGFSQGLPQATWNFPLAGSAIIAAAVWPEAGRIASPYPS